MSTHIPRFKKHPTRPKEYAELLRQRETIVGKLLYMLEKTHWSQKSSRNLGYDRMMEQYRATMRQLEAMEDLEELTGINVKPFENEQPWKYQLNTEQQSPEA